MSDSAGQGVVTRSSDKEHPHHSSWMRSKTILFPLVFQSVVGIWQCLVCNQCSSCRGACSDASMVSRSTDCSRDLRCEGFVVVPA